MLLILHEAPPENDIEVLVCVQRRNRAGKGLKHKPCEQWLRVLGVFRLEKRRLKRGLITL